MRVFFIVLLSFVSSCCRERVGLFDESRIVSTEIRVRNFDLYNDNYVSLPKFSTIRIKVLDTIEKSVKYAFDELSHLEGENELPIYSVYCYAHRNIATENIPSKHAYAAAIDINPYMNPAYYSNINFLFPNINNNNVNHIVESLSSCCNIKSDRDRKYFVLNYIKLPAEYNDCFLNRNIKRSGMIMPIHAKIMKKYGFDRWGGNWRYPIDYMHFEIADREFIKKLVSVSSEEAAKMWDEHIVACRKSLAEELYKEREKLNENLKLLGVELPDESLSIQK